MTMKNDLREKIILEKMNFKDREFIECFRRFMNRNLTNLLQGLEEDYILEEMKIKDVEAISIRSPRCVNDDRVIIYLHGGCYMSGDIKNYCTIPVQISNTTGIQVISVDYGLAPERPFPSGLNQAVEVYKALLHEGYKGENIAIMGDSAGGGLAIAITMKLRDMELEMPSALGVFSPWVDLTLKGDTINTLEKEDVILSKKQLEGAAEIYAVDNSKENPFISPLFGEFMDFPPMMIITGAREMLLSDSTNLARRAILHGAHAELLVWDEQCHVFAADSSIPESKEAIGALSNFLDRHMKRR